MKTIFCSYLFFVDILLPHLCFLAKQSIFYGHAAQIHWKIVSIKFSVINKSIWLQEESLNTAVYDTELTDESQEEDSDHYEEDWRSRQIANKYPVSFWFITWISHFGLYFGLLVKLLCALTNRLCSHCQTWFGGWRILFGANGTCAPWNLDYNEMYFQLARICKPLLSLRLKIESQDQQTPRTLQRVPPKTSSLNSWHARPRFSSHSPIANRAYRKGVPTNSPNLSKGEKERVRIWKDAKEHGLCAGSFGPDAGDALSSQGLHGAVHRRHGVGQLIWILIEWAMEGSGIEKLGT